MCLFFVIICGVIFFIIIFYIFFLELKGSLTLKSLRVPAYSPVNTVNPTFLGSSFAEYTQQMKIKSNPQTHAVSITPGVFVTLHTLLPKKK